jgi:hypothetical protein
MLSWHAGAPSAGVSIAFAYKAPSVPVRPTTMGDKAPACFAVEVAGLVLARGVPSR